MDEQHQVPPEPVAEPAPDNSVMDSILPPVKPKHFLGAAVKFLLILIVIAAIAGGAVWFFTRDKTTKPATATTTPTTTTSPTSTSVTKITSATKHYDSSNYNLGLDYPADWTVNDQASAKLTITSPALQLKTTNDDAFTGQIVFAVQNQQTSIAAFAKNTAVAALQSQKIAYKKPTPNQRAQTYVTFVNYGGDVALIDALYVTGDNGYQAAQYVPQADVLQANPLVTISFLKCADTACKTPGTALAITAKSWADTSLSKPLLNILQSLTIE